MFNLILKEYLIYESNLFITCVMIINKAGGIDITKRRNAGKKQRKAKKKNTNTYCRYINRECLIPRVRGIFQ